MKKLNRFLKLLKELMDTHNVKIPQLALDTGIPQNSIYSWFQRNTKPDFDNAVTIAQYFQGKFNIPVERFIYKDKAMMVSEEPADYIDTTTHEIILLLKDTDEDFKRSVMQLVKEKKLLAKLLEKETGEE